MSFDKIPGQSDPRWDSPPAKIQDVLVYFQGVQSMGELGQPVTNPVELGPEVTKLKALLADSAYSKDHAPLKTIVYKGNYKNSNNVQAARRDLAQNFDPFGKIIVAAYSLGGRNALEFCKILEPYYSFDWKQLVKTPDSSSVKVRIDLLFTCDPSFDPQTASKDRIIPAIVRRSVNYYQKTDEKAALANGETYEPTEPQDKAATSSVNIPQDNLIPDDNKNEKDGAHEFVCERRKMDLVGTAKSVLLPPTIVEARGIQYARSP
jgi:hypothetical protein